MFKEADMSRTTDTIRPFEDNELAFQLIKIYCRESFA